MKLSKFKGVEGGPPQDDGPSLILDCGQRPIFSMVEGLWPKTAQRPALM